jgi:hypothetical protein
MCSCWSKYLYGYQDANAKQQDDGNERWKVRGRTLYSSHQHSKQNQKHPNCLLMMRTSLSLVGSYKGRRISFQGKIVVALKFDGRYQLPSFTQSRTGSLNNLWTPDPENRMSQWLGRPSDSEEGNHRLREPLPAKSIVTSLAKHRMPPKRHSASQPYQNWAARWNCCKWKMLSKIMTRCRSGADSAFNGIHKMWSGRRRRKEEVKLLGLLKTISRVGNGLVCTLASTISTVGIVLSRLNCPIWKLWPRASCIDCDCQVTIIGELTKAENASKEGG